MPKNDRITIRLDAEMGERLSAKASALGLDVAAYARMLIYRDVNHGHDPLQTFAVFPGSAEPAADVPLARGGFAPDAAYRPTASPVESAEEAEEGPRAEEVEIPPDADGGDPSLDNLLRAGPSLLDEMMGLTVPNPAAHGAPSVPQQGRTRTYRAPLSNRNRGVQPMYGPGSMTRAVGVNEMAVSASFGDGGTPQRDTVFRENMRHFGIAQPRMR